MKIRLYSIILAMGLLLQSCGFGDIGKWDISGLSVLKIEGSSKVVYKYDAWGGFDSHAFGYRLMDSTETFRVDQAEDLPFYDLLSIPTKSIILGFSHTCAESCGEFYANAIPKFGPIEIQNSVINNIEIEYLIYQYKGYSKKSNGFDQFEFKNFVETRDSLFFFDLDDVKSKNGKHLDVLKIKKRMVEIQNVHNQNDVGLIVIKDVEIDMNKELKSYKTYHLTPKEQISIDEFSDYGIFKPVRVESN